MNLTAKATNSIAKVTNSIANGTNSVAKPMNSIANGTNSIAKAINSIANETNSIAKVAEFNGKNLYYSLICVPICTKWTVLICLGKLLYET